MKLPGFLHSKASTASESPATTLAPARSERTSSDLEKPAPALASSSGSVRSDSHGNGEKVVETTALEEIAAVDKLSDDEHEYPTGGKLAVITAALCLSVFLMALVSASPITFRVENAYLSNRRLTRS